jgi:hypothetical protein
MIGSSRDTEKKQMTESTITSDWGMHLNESMYSMYCPPCPKWATAWESEKWHRLGVVVWDANVHRVAHLRGREALDQLFHLRQSDTWKREGLLVGEFAYSITIPDNTKPKKKKLDQPEDNLEKKDRWRMINTIQLSPDQTRRFFLFLEEKETTLHNVVQEEEKEWKRILGQVYSLILGWRKERLKNNPTINTNAEQQTDL